LLNLKVVTYARMELVLVELNGCAISILPSSWATSKLLLKRPPLKLLELPELVRPDDPVNTAFRCCCCKSCILFNAAIFVKDDEETDLLSWCCTDNDALFEGGDDGPDVFKVPGVPGCCALLLLIRQIDDVVRANGVDLRRFGGVVNLRPTIVPTGFW